MKQLQSPFNPKEHLRTNEQGFSALEGMLSGALLLIIGTAFAQALIMGQETVQLSGDRTRAIFLADEGLQAARNIKQNAFSNLINGTWGLSTSTGAWSLSGTSNTLDRFTRQLTISSVGTSTKQVQSQVSWQQNIQRSGTVALSTYFTDWSLVSMEEAELVTVDVSGASMSGDNKEVRNIELINTSSNDIVVTKMTVSWTTPSRKIERIKIDEDTVWSKSGPGTPTGTQSSGTELDIQNYTLEAGENTEIENMKFTGSMQGSQFTVMLTFGDGSTKTFTVF